MCFFNEQWARHILMQVYLSTLLGSFSWMGFSNRWAKYINYFVLFAHNIVLQKNASNFCAISKVFSCQHIPQTLCCHLFILCYLINFSVCRAVHLALWKYLNINYDPLIFYHQESYHPYSWHVKSPIYLTN